MNSYFDPRFEPDKPFSEADIDKIEGVLGRALPEDYRKFVMIYGGCFVGGSFDGQTDFPILTFFGPDEENGILSMLAIYSDLRTDGVLPFADCELGNLYVLDPDNKVSYINYYGGRTSATKLCDSFEAFLSRIKILDD